jgi:hypothetical protein
MPSPIDLRVLEQLQRAPVEGVFHGADGRWYIGAGTEVAGGPYETEDVATAELEDAVALTRQR